MTQVVTFERFVPVARYDSLPWTQVRIEEAATEDGAYAEIETIALSPVDDDPTDPQARSFTTEDANDGELWYRIIFVDANGDESAPTDPIQNTDIIDAYATIPELARILKIRTPSTDQTYAMGRVLLAAAGEINNEISLTEGNELAGWHLELAAQVNLERAAELWKLQEVQFGVILGGELGAVHIARDSWKKHEITLGPLKQNWGFA
jgi:predicted carbohydrate-binding protein with CBM5 and CBM33 domain